MPSAVSKDALAKINLALHVIGQRSDGYHLLDSLVTFANFGDRLTFEPADQLSLAIDGPFSNDLEPDDENLILKAAHAMRSYLNRPELGARITLQKNLPIASGIGGGSADGAAALSGLKELWGCNIKSEDLKKMALSLGADIPVCLEAAPARMQGIGEDITPISIPSFPVILVNPNKIVPTSSVFNGLKRKDNFSLGPLPENEDWLDYLKNQQNDLQRPAMELEPSITDCLNVLRHSGTCNIARMSGSGATCFGLFETTFDAETAAHAISKANPNWWVVATSTIIGQAENADNLGQKT